MKKGHKTQENLYYLADSPTLVMDDNIEGNPYQNDGKLDGVNEDIWLGTEDIKLDEEHMNDLEEDSGWDDEDEVDLDPTMSSDAGIHVWENKVKAKNSKVAASQQKKFPPSNFAQCVIYNSSDGPRNTKTNFQTASNLEDIPESAIKRKRYIKEKAVSINRLQQNKHTFASPIRQKKVTCAPNLPMDSPDPSLVPRKRPGESIYKAPGMHNLASR